jgi:hypothetical protein
VSVLCSLQLRKSEAARNSDPAKVDAVIALDTEWRKSKRTGLSIPPNQSVANGH